jgi:hypothetical protein
LCASQADLFAGRYRAAKDAYCVVSLGSKREPKRGSGGSSGAGAVPVVGVDWLTESVLSCTALPLHASGSSKLRTFPAGRRMCSVGEAVLVQRDKTVEAVVIDSVSPDEDTFVVTGRAVRRLPQAAGGGGGGGGSGGGCGGGGSSALHSSRATCMVRVMNVTEDEVVFQATAVVAKVVLLNVGEGAWADSAFGCDREVWAMRGKR